MSLRVFNTFSKSLEEFQPITPGKVSLYVCGLTPYDSMHIGHARTYIAFDVIRRYLEFTGLKVHHVMNVTDIDDKIIKRAAENKEEPLVLSKRCWEKAKQELQQLGNLPAHENPLVSESISGIIAMVSLLARKGFAYQTDDGVYYSVHAFKDYGKLSGQSLEEIKSGARIAVDEKKKHPADFALWKAAKPGEISFDSPWGKGRPGWHIECSVMSKHCLGETVDIHGGAVDLIFPHHENEIAQSEAANAKQFVKYWMHTGWLTIKKEKMSKSLRNFITVETILSNHEPDAIRIFFSSTHYRSPIDYNEQLLQQSHASLERLRNALVNARAAKPSEKPSLEAGWIASAAKECKQKFCSAMDNDFDTSNALAALFELAGDLNTYSQEQEIDKRALDDAVSVFLELSKVLGLRLAESEKASEQDRLNALGVAMDLGLHAGDLEACSFNEIMQKISSLRQESRLRKDYAVSDVIRSKLAGIGFVFEDTPNGTVWKKK